jgi:hypothetical protein
MGLDSEAAATITSQAYSNSKFASLYILEPIWVRSLYLGSTSSSLAVLKLEIEIE